MKKEKEEQRRKEEEEKERIRREKEEHRRRIEEEEKERIRVEREKEEQRRKVEEEEKERIRIETEKEEQKRRIEEEEKERIRIEREKDEQKRRMVEEEKERIRMEREKEEQRRKMAEEKERIRMEREKEEERRRMEEEEKERIRMEREIKEQRRRTEEEEKERIRIEREKEEQKRRMVEEEKERIRMEREKEEQKRRMEEEEKERRRIEVGNEEQRIRIEEEERERQRIEKEEQRRKLEEEERIRMKREKEEQMRKLEEERKRKEEREAEELRRKIEEENDRKKEEEKMRIAEEERMKEEKKRAEKKRMIEEEEKHKEEKRIEMEQRLADEKKAREEEERRIAEEKEKQRKEEERVREEKERKKAELEIKRKEEEQKRRNMEIDEKKKKEKQMREEQEGLRKEENLFEESVISQSTDFTRSARISNVKPSVSVSATVTQPSMANTNPFLDDDLDASISENIISVEETTAKKGRAPLPPHKKPQLTGSDVSSRGVPKQHSHLKEVSKRAAPQPPGMMTREVTVKEKTDQAGLGQGARKTPERHHASKVSSVSQDDTQVDTNPFTCDGPVAVKHNKRPAPKPRSGISVSEDKPKNDGKNLIEGTVHHEEKASASNSKGNPPNWKLLSIPNDITAEHVISDLTDDLSQGEKHLEDIVELDSAKPNAPSCVNQDLCPEPLISNTDGLPSMERSKKKSQAPLPPAKPKRTGDPSTPHQQPSLLNKTNLEQAQESHSNKKYQDNALASSVEILGISTPSSSTVSSSPFTPLAEKSQVMKPCATESLETDSGSGSSTLPWAKVVPSDAGQVREQVAPISVIRQHAVKPLSAAENQPEIHESRVTDNTQPKTTAASAVMKGPYSQLTQSELISLALRQQEQISQRDARIQELEQYIDNLLVRVMEEKPSILMTMNAKNKSM
ncbi:hypothetical protein PHYPO_G00082630 [Pangasianodon hypophthalmus]|uniref:FIP-RBD domain-containing protein n=2 Tax=Pangasianodon hypophthalmus TaxID=310915 RepID=A0A5N5LLP4_PANHP|nr:hypothetical protein PHYPO_G00082630 [Pangasianodon hypophthalmus]